MIISSYSRLVILQRNFSLNPFGIFLFHSNHREALNREIKKYEKRLHLILAIRWQKKSERDHIDVRESNAPSLLNSYTENVDIPSHEPLNLTEHQINPHLSQRCSKGPSFIPTPSSVNWYALLKDFDNFKHKARCKVHFYDTSNKTELTME